MRIFYKTLLITMMLLSLNAKSFTPESGFWISPGVPGTGYSIEIQDNFMFVALYVYDEFGVFIDMSIHIFLYSYFSHIFRIR